MLNHPALVLTIKPALAERPSVAAHAAPAQFGVQPFQQPRADLDIDQESSRLSGISAGQEGGDDGA